jgi:ribose-phosphate pyrophosphokinase
VLACAVHGVLSGPAIERIEKSPLDQMIVTNSIPLREEAQQCKKIVVLSWRGCWARRSGISTKETSVSSLFV